MMHVHELMTKDVITAEVDTPISQILAQMQQRNIHQIPVLAKPDKHHEAGDLVGIVILNRIITRELDTTKATAKALLTIHSTVRPSSS
jgi:CBS domain-containing protein